MSRIAAYRENGVLTQSRGQLVVMLYEGAIKFLEEAIPAIEKNDYAEKGRLIGKAMDIVAELDSSLDFGASEELCTNLRSLYDFMQRHLFQANLKCDVQAVRDVIKLLDDLNQAWRAISI
jgi:flagellar protein FliS